MIAKMVQILTTLALATGALAASSCSSLKVRNTGEPVGELKNISGSKFSK
jgi:hypothetical protein